MLLSHVFIGVTDFDRAFAFYEPLMARLGHRLRFVERAGESPPLVQHWCGWQAADADRPLLLVGTAFDGQPATPGHGQMVALLAPDRATVDAVHALALSLGGRCDGPPGPRPHYHANYYGAYVHDPDGNKLCVCCHAAEGSAA
ncbi:Glyoxalase-like domain protein [Xylophilus ampelinus]|nr:Glyoxalase-like domain protein [Xylophilus ampelinus]